MVNPTGRMIGEYEIYTMERYSRRLDSGCGSKFLCRISLRGDP